MKNIIVVTGGAGFVGSNLINYYLKKTRLNIVSLDNYSTGKKQNLIKTQKIFLNLLIDIKKKLMQFFTLENLQEYIKALIIWMNVLIQIA